VAKLREAEQDGGNQDNREIKHPPAEIPEESRFRDYEPHGVQEIVLKA
jgi:hypothetical protein